MVEPKQTDSQEEEGGGEECRKERRALYRKEAFIAQETKTVYKCEEAVKIHWRKDVETQIEGWTGRYSRGRTREGRHARLQ